MSAPRHWPNASDAQLVRGIRDGDEAAFEELHRRFRGAVTRRAARLLGSTHPAVDDVVQDVFWRAFSALPRTDGLEVLLLPWLMRVTRNRCVDELRSARARHEVCEPDVLDRMVLRGPSVVTAVATREALRETVVDIRALPPRQRDALLGVVVQGRSHRELAAELSATVQASKGLVNRARAELIAMRAVRAVRDRPAA